VVEPSFAMGLGHAFAQSTFCICGINR